MKPSIHYVNKIQTDSNFWVTIPKISQSLAVNNNLKETLLIEVEPISLLNADADLTSSQINYSDDIEAQVFRINDLSMLESMDFRQFLSPDNTKDFVVYNEPYSLPIFNFNNYIEITLNSGLKTEKIEIGLPFAFGKLNYYDGLEHKSCPYNIRPAIYKNQSLTNYFLESDYTISATVQDSFYSFSNLYSQQALTCLAIDGIGKAIVTVRLYLNNVLISEIDSLVANQHLPKVKFTSDLISLTQLAVIIKNCINDRPFDYKQVTLSYLTKLRDYLQAGNKLIPSTLNLQDIFSSPADSYSFYDLSYLTLLIQSSVQREDFYDYQTENIIDELIEIIVSSYSFSQGLCVKSVDNFLVPISSNDISTSILLFINLSHYLTYKYYSTYKYISVLLKQTIDSVLSNLSRVLIKSIPENLDILFSIYLVSKYLRQDNYINTQLIPVLLDYLNAAVSSGEELLIELILRLNYIAAIETITLPSQFSYTEYIEQIPNSEMWKIKTDSTTEGSLYLNSWVNLITKRESILPSYYEPDDKLDRAEAIVSYLYKSSLSYLPYGDYWFDINLKAEESEGAVNGLLRGIKSSFYPLAFDYICLVDSKNIDKGYGFGLDKWGITLGLPRKRAELDRHYKKRLKARLILQEGTKEQLEQYVQVLSSSPNTQIVDLLPETIVYNNQDYSWIDFEDLIQKSIEEYQGEGVLTRQGFYSFKDNLNSLKVVSYENEVINEMFYLLTTLGIRTIVNNNIEYYIDSSKDKYLITGGSL